MRTWITMQSLQAFLSMYCVLLGTALSGKNARLRPVQHTQTAHLYVRDYNARALIEHPPNKW